MTNEHPQTLTTRQLAAMLIYALDLVRGYPCASHAAIADKLLTVWPGSGREVRMQVAITARLGSHQLAA
jgi:hypothetical protein